MVIAIFGARIGSPTDRDLSGTVEEIYKIYTAQDGRLGQHAVQAYFYDRKVPISEVNLEDLAGIRQLQERLSKDGFLYSSYEETSELLDAVERGVRKSISSYNKHSVIESFASESSDIEELGLYEVQDNVSKNMGLATQYMDNSSKFMAEFSPKLEAISKQFSADLSITTRKRLLDNAANEMNMFAQNLTTNGEGMLKNFEEYEPNVFLMFDILEEMSSMSEENISSNELLKSLMETNLAVNSAADEMSRLKDTVATLPRLTRELNASKRYLINAIDINLKATHKFSEINAKVLENLTHRNPTRLSAPA